jgi:hypothetical protein
MPTTKQSAFRLTDEDLARIDRIAEVKEGLSKTQVVRNAIDLYHRQVCGRRAPDLKPVKDRRAGPVSRRDAKEGAEESFTQRRKGRNAEGAENAEELN